MKTLKEVAVILAWCAMAAVAFVFVHLWYREHFWGIVFATPFLLIAYLIFRLLGYGAKPRA